MKLQLGWPQVALACVALLCLTAVLLWGDAETKAMVETYGGWVFGAVSAFLGPAVRRRPTYEVKGRIVTPEEES